VCGNQVGLKLSTSQPGGTIVISDEALTGKEISAICACYAIGTPTEQARVYRGTSSVYRLVCTSPQRTRIYALKVQQSDSSLESAKHLEAEVLDALPPAFWRVPVLLRPCRSEGAMQSWTWGLLWHDRAISVYHWVDSLPYAGTLQQRRAAARCFGELQNRLHQLSSQAGWGATAAAVDSLLEVPSAGFIPDFLASERARYDAHQAGGLSYSALRFLQEQSEIARTELGQNSAYLLRADRGLLHAEFSPPNCGYDKDGEVRIVFDFETLRFGLVPLAGAMAIAAFTLTPSAGTRETARRMAELLGELRSVCPAASPPSALLLPLLRLAYVDAAWRQLRRRRANPTCGWGYLRDDIENLLWLDENGRLIAEN
jgi:hypothetical protein